MTTCHHGVDSQKPCHKTALVTVKDLRYCPSHARVRLNAERNRRAELGFRIGDDPVLRAALERVGSA